MIGLASYAASGMCYELRDVANVGGTPVGTAGTTYGTQATPANCIGTNALTNATAAKW